MEQLLDMGFSPGLAAEALAATGSQSTADAAEWILNQSNRSNGRFPSSSDSPPNPNPQQKGVDGASSSPRPPTTCQPHQHPRGPNIDHYFSPKRPPPAHGDDFQEAAPFKRPRLPEARPLSERMRPRTVDEVLGQDHLLGAASVLRSSLLMHRLPSLVLWGPPGSGKTSIARALSDSVSESYRFVSLSAVTAGVKDVRDVVDEARRLKRTKKGTNTILFVDEVHRFNKSQQDSFLPAIEDGTVVFLGATTENPSFHLVTPLLSRCRVLKLNPLKPPDIASLLRRAAVDVERGLARSVLGPGGPSVMVKEEVFEFLSLHCDGDARVALNALEIATITAAARAQKTQKLDSKEGENSPQIESGDGEYTANVSLDDAKEALQCKHLAYDRAGEEHYNLISALHKSMRGSDADASIYWLARMVEGGENPLYIARRLVRFASEDVGLADPAALGHAVTCYQACHFLGMPECSVNLAQCVAYLALAPKSVAVYRALGAAQKVVRESGGGNEGVPLHLRNAPTKLMKHFGYGKDYIYTPDDPLASQTYLPPSLQGYKFLDWPPPSPCTSLEEKLL
ncbi:hypothetical protein H6P81_019971 [Aristolochia fimbriata]|uniref:UBA domain-containing protein n=1 Tax=Aristolochia fimbriata TaxID=158543 RepID=A0AAV7DUE4_ARIFI|nr:hypothetical protein H6P81_019971 [Aristolochia fimbriata]